MTDAPDPPEPSPDFSPGSSSMSDAERAGHRRKVRRTLLGLIVAVLATGLLAYGCNRLRTPRTLTLPPTAAGLTLQPDDAQAAQLRTVLASSGATSVSAGRYRGPGGDVLLAGDSPRDLSPDELQRLLPALTGPTTTFPAAGGALLCGPIATGARCVWGDADVVGATVGNTTDLRALAELTRQLRSDVVRAGPAPK